MRFGIILGYIIGNKQTRDWIIQKVCQASCLVENELKKSPLGQLFIQEKKDDNVSEVD
jgi:hypothetical protein